MSPIKKIVKNIVRSFIALVALMLMLTYLLLNSFWFQNKLAVYATSYLSAQFKTNITIERIRYNPFVSFTLENIYFGDNKKDTLFFVRQLDFKLGEINLDQMRFGLRKVNIDGGYCKLTFYKDSSYSMDVLFNILDPNDTIPDTISPPFHLYFEDVNLINGHFKLYSHLTNHDDPGFDGLNEDFYNISLKAEDFHIVKDSLALNLLNLSCDERSGFKLTSLSARTIITPNIMSFDSLHVITPHSRIGNYFVMKYNGWDELADFNEKVRIDGILKNTTVDMLDIAYFAPQLKHIRQKFKVNAKGKGTISNLRIKDIDISFGRQSNLIGRVNINGLPNIDNMYVDADIKSLNTIAKDIESFIDEPLDSSVYRIGNVQFSGAYIGFLNDFVAYGDFITDIGNITSDMNLKTPQGDSVATYSGKLSTQDFNLGKMLDIQNQLGKLSMELKINGKGFDFNSLHNQFDLSIKSIEAVNYTYRNIEASGELKHKNFTGAMVAKDPNADLDFKGKIDFNKKIPHYHFVANLNYINLQKLKFDTADIVIAAKVNLDFAYSDIDHNEGDVNINNINFIKNGRDYSVNKIQFTTSSNNNSRSAKFISDGIEFGFDGNIEFLQLENTFDHITSQLFPVYFSKSAITVQPNKQLNVYAKIKNFNTLSHLFFPWFNIQQANVSMSYASNGLKFSSNSTIQELKLYDLKFNDVSFNIQTPNSKTRIVDLRFEKLFKSDSSILNNVGLKMAVTQDDILTSIDINDSLNLIHADLDVRTHFVEKLISFTFEQSNVRFRNSKIAFERDGSIHYTNEKLKFNDLVLKINESQQVVITGFNENNGSRNIRADLTNINLDAINNFYRKSTIEYDGIVNGALILKSANNVNIVDAYLKFENLAFDNDTIGDFTLNSNYSNKLNKLMVYAKAVKGKLNNFEAGGYLSLIDEKEIDLSISFDDSPLKSFQAFVKEDMFIYAGTASVKGKITGTISEPKLNGALLVNNVKTRIEYLKTTYSFSSKLDFDLNSIEMTPTQIADENGNLALIKGSINHKYFSKFDLDISLSQMKKFNVLKTTAKDNDLFYGTAFVSGAMSIKGPIDDLFLDVHFKTENNTSIFLPLAGDKGVSESGIIHIMKKDSSIKTDDIIKKSALSGFTMSIYLDVTPDAEIQMILDPKNDDKIRGKGTGILKMELTKQGVFSMFGSIEIEEGDYKLTAANLFTRKFIIAKGGRIDWIGDPLGARMNIKGVYKVRRTSIAEIITTATEEEKRTLSTQRVPVDCILLLEGSLLSPDIKFDLNFPQMDGIIGTNNVSGLDNSLRTLRNNPDMMNQQVISLLLFGRFVSMGGLQQINSQDNLSSGLNNTVSDLFTAQANNLIGKIVPGLDFNVDIQTGVNQQQSMQYVFSASKKWFDDRLEVQGSYNPQNFNNSFMTQYNLTKTGNLKTRFFNRNTSEAFYNRNVTTQGLGLFYSKEFDKFSELFKRK